MEDDNELPNLLLGILTVSDSCSRGNFYDSAGEKIKLLFHQNFKTCIVKYAIVSDDQIIISNSLKEWSDELQLHLIITVGGTGFSPRDVTPEATKSIIDKDAPGIVHKLLKESINITPMGICSRLHAGIRNKTLIINFPGSKKASEECFYMIWKILPHAIDVLRSREKHISETHMNIQGTSTERGHFRVTSVDPSRIVDRARKSIYPMISVEDAQKTIGEVADSCSDKLGIETVLSFNSLGFILAQDICSDINVPPFKASIKDGYAIIVSDKSATRFVMEDAAIPGADLSLQQSVVPGYCMRINTGAPLPPGADGVVQIEDTTIVGTSLDGTKELEIKMLSFPSEVGHDVRSEGCDIAKGSLVLKRGTLLGPAELGLLASIGCKTVQVKRKPSVALLSTGNELIEPDEEQRQGIVYDANKTSIHALLLQENCCSSVFDCGISPDDPQKLMDRIDLGLNKCDLLVCTGGVSMGDCDYLKQVLIQDFEATIIFGRVFMKPGKPTVFASLEGKGGCTKLVLGLPGNPASALVTSHLFVLPLCRKLSGFDCYLPPILRTRLVQSITLDPRPEYRRATLSWDAEEHVLLADSARNQLSSCLASARSANLLLVLPPASENCSHLEAGSDVNAIIIGPLMYKFMDYNHEC